MVNSKYNITLFARNLLEEYKRHYPDLFDFKINTDGIRLLSKDTDIVFVFLFRRINENRFYCAFNPKNEHSTSVFKGEISNKTLLHKLDLWCSLVKKYKAPSILFDDMITQGYYEELSKDFTIIDEDAHYKSYDYKTQNKIIKILDGIEKSLHNEPDNEDKFNALQLIDSTKRTITKSTKKEVFEKIKKIVALCMKLGKDIGRAVLIKIGSDAAKTILGM